MEGGAEAEAKAEADAGAGAWLVCVLARLFAICKFNFWPANKNAIAIAVTNLVLILYALCTIRLLMKH